MKPLSGRKKFGEQQDQSQSSLNRVAHHREMLRTANCTKEAESPFDPVPIDHHAPLEPILDKPLMPSPKAFLLPHNPPSVQAQSREFATSRVVTEPARTDPTTPRTFPNFLNRVKGPSARQADGVAHEPIACRAYPGQRSHTYLVATLPEDNQAGRGQHDQ